MSRPTPRLPDAALLGPRPFGAPAIAEILRSAPLCVAVSGGADSVALLHALVRLRAWLGGRPPYGLVAAHFHHGIRGAEADADAAFVADLCASLRVPLATGRGDVPAEDMDLFMEAFMNAIALGKERARKKFTPKSIQDQWEDK